MFNHSVIVQLFLLLRMGHCPGSQWPATTSLLKGKRLVIYCDKGKSPHKDVDNKRKQSVTTNPQNCIFFLLKDSLKWLNSHCKKLPKHSHCCGKHLNCWVSLRSLKQPKANPAKKQLHKYIPPRKDTALCWLLKAL